MLSNVDIMLKSKCLFLHIAHSLEFIHNYYQ